MMKKFIAVVLLTMMAVLLVGCDDAKVASRNISKAADNFEVDRRVIFYNGITDTYMLTIEGKCAIDEAMEQLEVTCKVGKKKFKKHFLGLSDNVTYFAEQIHTIDVSSFHYRVTFKPQVIVPDIDARGSGRELVENASEANQ